VFNESTLDGQAVHGAFLLTGERPFQGQSLLQSYLVAVLVHGSVEQGTFLGRDGSSGGPGLVGRGSGGAFGSGGGVGLGLGESAIVAGPLGGGIVTGGVILGSSFQNAAFGRNQTNSSVGRIASTIAMILPVAVLFGKPKVRVPLLCSANA
jgi:hypothetical protein